MSTAGAKALVAPGMRSGLGSNGVRKEPPLHKRGECSPERFRDGRRRAVGTGKRYSPWRGTPRKPRFTPNPFGGQAGLAQRTTNCRPLLTTNHRSLSERTSRHSPGQACPASCENPFGDHCPEAPCLGARHAPWLPTPSRKPSGRAIQVFGTGGWKHRFQPARLPIPYATNPSSDALFPPPPCWAQSKRNRRPRREAGAAIAGLKGIWCLPSRIWEGFSAENRVRSQHNKPPPAPLLLRVVTVTPPPTNAKNGVAGSPPESVVSAHNRWVRAKAPGGPRPRREHVREGGRPPAHRVGFESDPALRTPVLSRTIKALGTAPGAQDRVYENSEIDRVGASLAAEAPEGVRLW